VLQNVTHLAMWPLEDADEENDQFGLCPAIQPQGKGGGGNFVQVLSAEGLLPADGEAGGNAMLLAAVPPVAMKSPKEKSLGVLCANFMELFKDMPPNRDNNGTVIEICQVADQLGMARQHISDVINISSNPSTSSVA
jgi:hypothetical protein